MTTGEIALLRSRAGSNATTGADVRSLAEEPTGIRRFVDAIDVLTEATGGTDRLRTLVLELAIRGQLSSSCPEDRPAAELLKAAHRDRETRMQQGEIKQCDALGPVGEEEAPFPLPSPKWAWTRIGAAMHLVNGRAFKPAEWSTSGLPIVRIQNLNNPDAPFNHCSRPVEPRFHLRPGDFLISWSGTPGTSFGAFIWNGPAGLVNQHIFRAETYGGAYDPRFLRIAINARLDEMIAQAHGGVGLQHITKGKLEALALPLPPITEQKRIVAKVDELMRLLDDLETTQTAQRAKQGRFRSAALDALTSAEGPKEVATAWRRVAKNFEVLFEHPESVADIRRVIRTFGVRGLLLPQLPLDDSVHELLALLRNDLDRSGRHWHAPERPQILADAGFTTPSSWTWVRLEHVTLAGPTNGYSPKAVDFPTQTKTLTLTATTSGVFRPEHFKYIDVEIPPASPLWLEDGDLLIQRANTLDYVGTAAVYHGPAHTFVYPDLIMKVRVSKLVSVEYIHLVLTSDSTRAFYRSRATGTAGSMPKINQRIVAATPIPLPPRQEQDRIVAKVARLMTLCDDLEAKLRQADDTAGNLAEAIVAELVSA